MGFVSTRLAPRKRPCTNIIVYQCWAIVGPASVADAPASCQIRLQRQGCCYALAFTAPLSPLAWPQAALYHRPAITTMTLQETDPLTHHRGPSHAWARSEQWRLAVGGQHAGVQAGPGLLTLGPDPGLLSSCGVMPRPQKTEVSCREQGMSSYSLKLNQELCPAQRWPLGTEQVSRARLLLLATDQRVKAAALIREGILLWRYVWKVPISWN